jgi:predicted transcriptional regulator
VPIGLGCQLCERSDCQHRSVPPIGHEMRFDLTKRHVGLYHLRG